MSKWSKIKSTRLEEQLKFFGARKTKFISCYAKKPRVRVKLSISHQSDHKHSTSTSYFNRDPFSAMNAMQAQAQALVIAQQQLRMENANLQMLAAQQKYSFDGASFDPLGLVGIGAALSGVY